MDVEGTNITDEKVIARIKALAIPPAWTKVWICPVVNGHLQVTGLDAKGRRQYLCHPEWRTQRDAAKFENLVEFGSVKQVAEILGNTPAVCRKSYIHPAILEQFSAGRLVRRRKPVYSLLSRSGLSLSERELLRFLRRMRHKKTANR
jgi:DNA topoisomerase IB